MNLNIKIIGIILGLLSLGVVAVLIFLNYGRVDKQALSSGNNTPFDFGDAPDGKESGLFPSLFKSDGARAKKTDEIWLGQSVTAETDSKQVNLDEADDGVKLDLKPCGTSKAYFFVHLKNPGTTSGTAYLNLWADWNKDGKWAGSDECAPEWAVRNFPIDLSKQNQEVAVFIPEFTAGKNIQNFWYRGIVSLNQQMNETATGEFGSGEVEDYHTEKPGEEKYYGAYCDPEPLKIKHGDKGDIKILPLPWSEPINKIEFGQNFGPKNDKRNVSIKDNVITYESTAKDVDGPKRTDTTSVGLEVSFGASGTEAVLRGFCAVEIEHDEITIKTPSAKNLPRRLLLSPTPIKSGTTPTTPPASEPHIQENIQEKAPGLMQ